ncbi:hypothetical protein CDAR_419201 [Caerostris darwini]|uniref:Uncharacterized protein n=1 Tax=Caerostris darwini TaxID=1538125 RepID=A0AAV4MVE0_9ARAC|nr:hypothetical protein CDAR_419201 [Caerostris darwini]
MKTLQLGIERKFAVFFTSIERTKNEGVSFFASSVLCFGMCSLESDNVVHLVRSNKGDTGSLPILSKTVQIRRRRPAQREHSDDGHQKTERHLWKSQ